MHTIRGSGAHYKLLQKLWRSLTHMWHHQARRSLDDEPPSLRGKVPVERFLVRVTALLDRVLSTCGAQRARGML